MNTNAKKKELLKLEAENEKWVLSVTAKDYKLEKYYYSLHDFNLIDVVNDLPRWVRLVECSLSFKEIK